MKALVLTSPGKNLAGAASVLSWTEYTELWGKVMGVVCTFQQVGDDVLPRLIPGGIGQELGDMIRYIDHFGYYGNDDPTMIWPKDVSTPPPVPSPYSDLVEAGNRGLALRCRELYQASRLARDHEIDF